MAKVASTGPVALSSRSSAAYRVHQVCHRYDKFLLSQRLGSGSFGIVYNSRDLMGRPIALKIVRLEDYKTIKSTLEPIECEALCWRRCNQHENISRLYECKRVNGTFYFSMERAIGDVYSLSYAIDANSGRMPESIVKRVVAQALKGLLYMHSKGVIHRDVKPSNMLITSDGRVLHSDFGWSKLLNIGYTTTTRGGTAEYLAPEFFDDKHYGHSIDLWALGMCMYEWLVGSNYLVTRMDSNVSGYKKRVRFLEEHSDLFARCSNSTALRQSSATLAARTIIKRFLEIDPSQRLGYSLKDPLGEFEKIMEKSFFKEIKSDILLPMDAVDKLRRVNVSRNRPEKVKHDMEKLDKWMSENLPASYDRLFDEFEWSCDRATNGERQRKRPLLQLQNGPPVRSLDVKRERHCGNA